MAEILFLSQRIPYPPNKGDKIRSWHILRHLAERHRVHLGCFYDDPADEEHVAVLRGVIGGELLCLYLNKRWAALRGAAVFLAGRSVTEGYFQSGKMRRWIASVSGRHRLDSTFIYSSAMAPYALGGEQLGRRVIDMVDLDSLKWQQYAARRRGAMRQVYDREGRRLLKLERRAAACFDATIFVSADEAQLFLERAPDCASRVHHFGNGVDTDYFTPERQYDNPFADQRPAIVFTGAMDYWPNVDAVTWFAEQVLPLLSEVDPKPVFWVVGANPVPAVIRLRGESVRVTGRVVDVRPYLAHGQVIVAPLRIARGVQNKVLEAMSMARPVVASPGAHQGIAAEPGRDLLVADLPGAFAQQVRRALSGEAAGLGASARLCVVRHHRWEASLRALDRLLVGASPREASPTAQAGFNARV